MSDFSSAREIPGTGKEIFFPKAPHPDPVYDIEICGFLVFHFWHLSWWDGSRYGKFATGRADAFFLANKFGRFEHPHRWFLVNGKPIEFEWNASCVLGLCRYAEKLEADRGSHTYRFRIDDPGECVGIAFHPNWKIERRTQVITDDHLIASVRVLTPGTPSLKGGRSSRSPETARGDTPRERIRERIEASGEERKAALLTILQKKQEILAELDAIKNLSPDTREQYVAEVEDWAAGELIKIAGFSKGGVADGKIIT